MSNSLRDLQNVTVAVYEDSVQILNVYPFDYTAFAVSGKVGFSWMAEVTPTDRPLFVRNCVIEVFDGVPVLPLDFFFIFG